MFDLRFIYVFSKEDKEKLEKLGYELMKKCGDGDIYVFHNKDQTNFESLPVNGVFSNTLTF